MTHALALLWSLAAPLLLGVAALAALGLRWRDDRVGFPAWAYMLGCLLLGAVLQASLEVGLPPGVWWLLPVPVVAGLVLLARRRHGAAHAAVPPVGRGYAALVVVGALLCLWFALAGMDRPVIEGDEGNIWSLKAKSLLVDFPARFAAEQVWNLHPDYPQLNPLLQAWVYALTGFPDFGQFESRWPIQLCDVALFVAAAAALRARLPARLAAPLALLLLLEPELLMLCRTAYADGMVALGLVVALDGFLRWRDGGSRAHGWLAGFGLAFALWSKNEAMLYAVSAAGAALLARLWTRPLRGGASRENLALLLPGVAVVGYTALWNRRFGMRSDLLGANPTGKSMFELMAEQWPERVPAMLGEAWRATTSLGNAHGVFAALVLAVALVPRLALGSRLAVPTLALLASCCGVHAVYIGSFLPLRFHLDTSYLRVLLQLLPAAVVLLSALLAAVVAGRPTRQTPEPA